MTSLGKYVKQKQTTRTLYNSTPYTRSQTRSVVSFEQWIDNEYDYLWHLYNEIQERNDSCGRMIFDTDSCSFDTFCTIAYHNSYRYKRHDAKYTRDVVCE